MSALLSAWDSSSEPEIYVNNMYGIQVFGSYHRKTTLCLHYTDWSVSAIYRNSQYLTPESIKYANVVHQKYREL